MTSRRSGRILTSCRSGLHGDWSCSVPSRGPFYSSECACKLPKISKFIDRAIVLIRFTFCPVSSRGPLHSSEFVCKLPKISRFEKFHIVFIEHTWWLVVLCPHSRTLLIVLFKLPKTVGSLNVYITEDQYTPSIYSASCVYICKSHGDWSCSVTIWQERWGAGVETQKNLRAEIGGWGRVPFNETYAPSLSTIYDRA